MICETSELNTGDVITKKQQWPLLKTLDENEVFVLPDKQQTSSICITKRRLFNLLHVMEDYKGCKVCTNLHSGFITKMKDIHEPMDFSEVICWELNHETSSIKPIKTATGGPTWVQQWQEKIVNVEATRGCSGRAFKTTQELTDILADKITKVQDRCIKGMVVGNVQSGKTASMIGVTAAAFDLGVDIVVILTGTDNTLRDKRIQDLILTCSSTTMKSEIEWRTFRYASKANPGPVGKQAGTIQNLRHAYQTLTNFLNNGNVPGSYFSTDRGIKSRLQH